MKYDITSNIAFEIFFNDLAAETVEAFYYNNFDKWLLLNSDTVLINGEKINEARKVAILTYRGLHKNEIDIKTSKTQEDIDLTEVQFVEEQIKYHKSVSRATKGVGAYRVVSIKNKIYLDFLKSRFDSLNRKNPPSDKKTFETTLTTEQIKNMFEELKNNGLVSDNSDYTIFQDFFGNVPLLSIKNKVEWTGYQNLLAYFINEIIRKKIVTDQPKLFWKITEAYFTKSQNLSKVTINYLNNNLKKPVKHPLIDNILKALPKIKTLQ